MSVATNKASQLISFLDKVETEIESIDENATLTAKSTKTVTNNNIFDEIKTKMIVLKKELNEKTEKIKLLEMKITELKETEEMNKIEYNKSIKSKLNKQKKEFELITNRHLLFIDRLLNDKQVLNKKCEDLTEEIKKINTNYMNKINLIQNDHKKLIKKLKIEWKSAQEIKQKQWIINKTKQIKTMTIKGLEPEIQRLIEENKKNLKLKEEEYLNLLESEKENLRQIYEEKLTNLTNKLNEENLNEIDILNQKYLKEIESMNKLKEMEIIKIKKCLNDQFEQEKKRNDELNQKELNKLIDLHKKETLSLKKINEEIIQNTKDKNQIEIKKLNEKYKIEKSEWIEFMNKKLNKQFKEKEIKMIEITKKQQNDEIDIIIDKLTNEYQEKINTLTMKHNNLMNEIKNDLNEEKNKTKLWMKQYQDLDENNKNIVNQYKDKFDLKCKEIQKLHLEIDNLNDINLKKDKENQFIENKYNECDLKMNEMKKDFDEKISKLNYDHSSEIECIQNRIKQTLNKKDDLIFQLKQQIEIKDIKINDIESLLNREKNDLYNLIT